MVAAKTIFLKAPLDEGVPGPEHFDIVKTTVDTNQSLEDGNVLVEVLYMSVDPYLRGRIKSSAGEGRRAMTGFVSGVVLESKNARFRKGDLFGGSLPFCTVQVVSQAATKAMWNLSDIDLPEDKLSLGISLFGMTGSTALAGLDVLGLNTAGKGKTLLVSAASGAVGTIAGQLAKNCYGVENVIGTCGGPEKTKKLKEFGYDHAIDYRVCDNEAKLSEELKKVAPEGIDGYFENVGSYFFDAAFNLLRPRGVIAVCGLISRYNDASAPGNSVSLGKMIYTQQTIRGFVCHDWLFHKRGNFLGDMKKWYDEGKVNQEETFYEGIEQWPTAFQSLFIKNNNIGKVVVRI